MSREYGLGHNQTNILDATPRELSVIRGMAAERVLRKARDSKAAHVVVGLHATFR